MSEAQEARQHANNMSVRKGMLSIIQDVDSDLDVTGLSKAAAGAAKLAEAVRRFMRELRIGNPLLRAVVGAVVGVVYLIAQIVYAIHKAAIKRRRSRIKRGLPVANIGVSPVLA